MKTNKDRTRRTKKRAHGTGAIIKKANGIYAFQYRDATGKKITKTLGTRNRSEAEKLAEPYAATTSAKDTAEAVQQIARAKDLIDSKVLPLAGTWEAFENTRPSAGTGTMGLYKGAFNRFKAWATANRASITDMADIDEQAASDWLASEWKSDISASTYNDRRGSMLTITKALTRPYRLHVNPWTATERKKMAGKQQHRLPLTREHVQKLLKAEMKQDVRALMLLALCAGMRLKDAAFLKWSDVGGGFITYRPEKTKNTSAAKVQVPALPLLAKTLNALPRDEDSDYIVPRLAAWYKRCSTGISRMLVRELHKITGKSVQELEGRGKVARSEYGFHSLRHTFCTEAARAGVPATLLAAMAGDTISTVDKFYIKLDLSAQPIEQLASIKSTLALSSGGADREREQLKQLADELSLEEVREILKEHLK
ncbi:MAG: integrase [Bacteroidia bacterium]|jgi:integrase